jgi:hypothetical protein
MISSYMADIDKYQEIFRVRVHQLLAWAYTEIKDKQKLNEMDEPSITGLIAEAIDRKLQDPNIPQGYQHYYVGDQTPVTPNGELGNKRLKLDIRIGSTDIRPNPRFVFEAKCLKTGTSTIGKYVGKEGMGAFLSGEYSQGNPEAAMLGLIQNKDVKYWHAELYRSFDEDKQFFNPKLKIKKCLSNSAVIIEIKDELESVHLRNDDTIIRIFHIFLICFDISF